MVFGPEYQEGLGGYRNYGPLVGPLNTSCRNILRTQQGTRILIATRMGFGTRVLRYWVLGPSRTGSTERGVEP